jgi:NAD dependent epimerase/dehydratase family enzyme
VTLATSSQRALPRKLLDAGFEFRHTDLRSALELALA